MVLQHLKIYNLRCYDQAEVDLDSKFNVIIGLNGQGKTSLLESIGLLSFFKSFRGAKNNEILRLNQNEGRVSGKVSHEGLEFEIDVKVWPHRKQASFNGKSCKYLSEYVGKLSAVSFAPSDIEIIRGAPENRRGWLDRLAQIFSPTHVDDVSNYQKNLDQRNKLLREYASGRISQLGSEFDIWTEQLAFFGSKITANRIYAARQSVSEIERHYERISNEKIPVILQYFREGFSEEESGQLDVSHDTFSTSEDYHSSLKNKLEVVLQKDRILGSTSVGPHRDDLEVFMAGNLAKAFGSQGEVRSLMLAMRLAEVEKHKEVKGYSPLLLIDDFSSELDAKRRKFLLEYLTDSGSQVFLTTTEEVRLGKIFQVNEGRIVVQ